MGYIRVTRTPCAVEIAEASVSLFEARDAIQSALDGLNGLALRHASGLLIKQLNRMHGMAMMLEGDYLRACVREFGCSPNDPPLFTGAASAGRAVAWAQAYREDKERACNT